MDIERAKEKALCKLASFFTLKTLALGTQFWESSPGQWSITTLVGLRRTRK
jgi:hypothetical protein